MLQVLQILLHLSHKLTCHQLERGNSKFHYEVVDHSLITFLAIFVYKFHAVKLVVP